MRGGGAYLLGHLGSLSLRVSAGKAASEGVSGK